MSTIRMSALRRPEFELLINELTLILINPLLVITGSEIACVRVVVKCGVL